MSNALLSDDVVEAIVNRVGPDVERLQSDLNDISARVKYCRDTLGSFPRLRSDQKVYNLGITRACKVLGVRFVTAKMLVARHPELDGYAAALSQVPATCPKEAVGYIYVAEHLSALGVIKIGFTINLHRRLRELRREYGKPLMIKDAVAGTYLTEFIQQRSLGPNWLIGEWFNAGGDGLTSPDFLEVARGPSMRDRTAHYLSLVTGRDDIPVPNSGPFRSMRAAEADLAKAEKH